MHSLLGGSQVAAPYITRFEESVARFLGVEECLAVTSCTTALHLACLALGLSPGNEVLVPALTYVASANAIAYCGARPVFVDCDPTTWNCTADLIDKAWTPHTVGVLVVHLYGLPAPIDQIAEVCRCRGAWLLEDCAESLGATVNGRATGTFGDASTFSFYGNKTISTGEGGMLHVRNIEKRRLARMLRGQGMDLNRQYWHPVIGYNYRMTNVAAAIGVGQMEMVDYHISERRRIAKRYSECLRPLVEQGLLRLPASIPGYEGTYWLFSAILSFGGTARRDEIMRRLASSYGVETRPFFVPMHHLPMYASDKSFPITELLSAHGMNLPTYSGLTDHEINEICAAVTRVVLDTA
jgi:perosamine synthetase